MRIRLGELLVQAGLLSEAVRDQALAEQAKTGARLGQILVDRDLVEEAELYDVIAEHAKIPRLNLAELEVQRAAAQVVDAAWASRYGVLPLADDGRYLLTATTDPSQIAALDELAFRSGRNIRLVLASDTELERLIRHVYHQESLDRRRSTERIGPHHHAAVEIDEGLIIRGIEDLRAEVQHVQDTSDFLPAGDDGWSAHREQLDSLISLCVRKGLFGQAEFDARVRALAKAPDPEAS